MSRKIRCIVIAVPQQASFDGTEPKRARDMLPWADPYIARLIARCQQEVATERRQKFLQRLKADSPLAPENSEAPHSAYRLPEAWSAPPASDERRDLARLTGKLDRDDREAAADASEAIEAAAFEAAAWADAFDFDSLFSEYPSVGSSFDDGFDPAAFEDRPLGERQADHDPRSAVQPRKPR